MLANEDSLTLETEEIDIPHAIEILPKPIAQTQGLPLDEAKHYIAELLDLAPIIHRLIQIDGYSRYWAETAAQQYRHYLFIKKKYGLHLPLPPSHEIDQVWHTHILFTQQYIEFCDLIYGRYAHHIPHLGLEAKTQVELDEMFALTQALHVQEYGEPFYTISRFAWKNKLLGWIGKESVF